MDVRAQSINVPACILFLPMGRTNKATAMTPGNSAPFYKKKNVKILKFVCFFQLFTSSD